MFIAEDEGRRLGMVRFDRGAAAWLVSINITPGERGKGHGTPILRGAIDEIGARPLLAEIKADNVASIRIFEHCKFRRVGNEGE